MSWYPPGLLREAIDVTTGAANVATVRTILAAPGAGLRYRLWGYAFGPVSTAQAPGNQRGDTRTSANLVLAQIETAGFNGGAILIPGGLRLPTNDVMNVLDQSSLAALIVTHLVYYTIEQA